MLAFQFSLLLVVVMGLNNALDATSVSWMLKLLRVKVSVSYINRAKPTLSNETAQLATTLCYISVQLGKAAQDRGTVEKL